MEDRCQYDSLSARIGLKKYRFREVFLDRGEINFCILKDTKHKQLIIIFFELIS